jgi:hypothetical protein
MASLIFEPRWLPKPQDRSAQARAPSNNNAAYFWILSEQGWRRIVDRTGWDVPDYIPAGDTLESDSGVGRS